jgi:hypothetical protein
VVRRSAGTAARVTAAVAAAWVQAQGLGAGLLGAVKVAGQREGTGFVPAELAFGKAPHVILGLTGLELGVDSRGGGQGSDRGGPVTVFGQYPAAQPVHHHRASARDILCGGDGANDVPTRAGIGARSTRGTNQVHRRTDVSRPAARTRSPSARHAAVTPTARPAPPPAQAPGRTPPLFSADGPLDGPVICRLL